MPRSAVSPSVVLTAQKSIRPTRRRVASASPLAVTLVLLSTSAVQAASLQHVNNCGATGVPDDITMYVYVPDNVVTNPPVLTLVHAASSPSTLSLHSVAITVAAVKARSSRAPCVAEEHPKPAEPTYRSKSLSVVRRCRASSYNPAKK